MTKGAIQAGNTNLTTRDIVFTSSAELTVLLSITLPGPVLDEKYIPYFDCVMVFPLDSMCTTWITEGCQTIRPNVYDETHSVTSIASSNGAERSLSKTWHVPRSIIIPL